MPLPGPSRLDLEGLVLLRRLGQPAFQVPRRELQDLDGLQEPRLKAQALFNAGRETQSGIGGRHGVESGALPPSSTALPMD